MPDVRRMPIIPTLLLACALMRLGVIVGITSIPRSCISFGICADGGLLFETMR